MEQKCLGFLPGCQLKLRSQGLMFMTSVIVLQQLAVAPVHQSHLNKTCELFVKNDPNYDN